VLVQLGVDKEAKDAGGLTALHHAVAKGHVEATMQGVGAARRGKGGEANTGTCNVDIWRDALHEAAYRHTCTTGTWRRCESWWSWEQTRTRRM
jgi:hypothetical protein